MGVPVSGSVEVAPDFGRFADTEGHQFEFARVEHPGGRGLVVHLSAFFGDWGEARRYRENFRGYFHRLRMLGSSPDHSWLFLYDGFGAYDNGCYYLGRAGDLFVERAVMEIVRQEMERLGIGPDEVVTVGSSMGATGALVMGLRLGAAGIVTVSPHIDLDRAATLCQRHAEVAYACPDGDPTSTASEAVTRRVRRLLSGYSADRPPPRLFVQACTDDAGVYPEQVPSLAEEWEARGRRVDLDLRPEGGHTSDFATRPLLLDVIARYLGDEPADIEAYQRDARFSGTLTRPSPWATALVTVRRRLRLRHRWNATVGRVRRR